MGYTHYWMFHVPKGAKANELEAKYQKAIKECNKVIRAYQKEAPSYARLSGYSAHAKPNTYGGIKFNGKAEFSHEDFSLREHFKQNIGDDAVGFCKTAEKPYDTVVVACLAILKYHLGDAIRVSSDGQPEYWDKGVYLSRSVLRRTIPNPINR